MWLNASNIYQDGDNMYISTTGWNWKL